MNATTDPVIHAMSTWAAIRAAHATRSGCTTPWCVLDHDGPDGRPGWCQGPKSSVVSPKPGEQAGPDGAPDVLLSARVTQVNEHPDAYGITTRLWLDYGVDTVELDVDQTDQLIGGMEAFLPQLRTARALLAEASANDRTGDEDAKERLNAEMDARIDAIDTAALEALCAEHGMQILVAEGPFPEDALFLTELVDGRRVAVIPPGVAPGNVLYRLRSMLAAMEAEQRVERTAGDDPGMAELVMPGEDEPTLLAALYPAGPDDPRKVLGMGGLVDEDLDVAGADLLLARLESFTSGVRTLRNQLAAEDAQRVHG